MFEFQLFKRQTEETPRHERYNEENVVALKQSILDGLNSAALDDARNTASDVGETSCLIPFTDDEAGEHAKDVLRALVGDHEAVWFKSNLQDWFLETLGGVPAFDNDGALVVSWANDTTSHMRRTLSGDPMNGDET